MLNVKKIFEKLHRVNVEFNSSTKYIHDAEQYDEIDYWQVPDAGRGDCEDYALAKRRRLRDIYEGNKDSFRIACCWVEGEDGSKGTGGYHAVLTVDTKQGTYVLDNRHPEVMAYPDLPYRWHKREPDAQERIEHGGKWMMIDG